MLPCFEPPRGKKNSKFVGSVCHHSPRTILFRCCHLFGHHNRHRYQTIIVPMINILLVSIKENDGNNDDNYKQLPLQRIQAGRQAHRPQLKRQDQDQDHRRRRHWPRPLQLQFSILFTVLILLSFTSSSDSLQFPFRRNNRKSGNNPKNQDDNKDSNENSNKNSNTDTSPIEDSENGKSMRKSFAKKRLVYGKDDALFGAVEKAQGDAPFGRLLDAGTGMHSLRWIATLHGDENKNSANKRKDDRTGGKGMTDFVAITADQTMQRKVQLEADALDISHQGKVIIGNWFGNSPLNFPEESFDTILADYLIGAMDGFSPYQQEEMIPKLARLLRPGGKLYIVGLQPIPDQAIGDANVICKVRQIRDACILLAGHRCYREFPVEWIHSQIKNNVKSLKLKTTTHFPILYRHETIVAQINVGRSKFPLFPSTEMADSMKKVLDDLEQQSLKATKRTPGGRIRLGFDYVVVAQKKTHEEVLDEEERQYRKRQQALGHDFSREETGASTVSGSSSTLESAPTLMSAASSSVIDGASTYTATTIDGASTCDTGTIDGASTYDTGTIDGASTYDTGTIDGASTYDTRTIDGASTYDATSTIGHTSTIGYTSTAGSRYDCYDEYGDDDDDDDDNGNDEETAMTALYAVREEDENEEEEGEAASAAGATAVVVEKESIKNSFDSNALDEQTTMEDGIEVVVVENQIAPAASGDDSTLFGNVEESFDNDDENGDEKQGHGADALTTASSDGDSTAIVENSTIMSAGLNTLHTRPNFNQNQINNSNNNNINNNSHDDGDTSTMMTGLNTLTNTLTERPPSSSSGEQTLQQGNNKGGPATAAVAAAESQGGEDASTILSAGLNTLLTPNNTNDDGDGISILNDNSTFLSAGLNTIKTNTSKQSHDSDNSANNNTVVSAVLEENSTLTGLNSL